MNNAATDPDLDVRLAAFTQLRNLMQIYGSTLPWAALRDGFVARGQQFRFASAAEGIFRPVGMQGVLSLKTVVPRPSGRVWYHDQEAPAPSVADETFSYAFRGSDPATSRNQWLRDAMERRLPPIYFYGVAPGEYEPLFPAFVTEWNPGGLTCGLSFSTDTTELHPLVPDRAERRYTLRLVQHRLH